MFTRPFCLLILEWQWHLFNKYWLSPYGVARLCLYGEDINFFCFEDDFLLYKNQTPQFQRWQFFSPASWWNNLCSASCEPLIQSWADNLQGNLSNHPIATPPTYHNDMRTQIQEPWGSQPLWRWMLGPKRAALAAKLHTQHLACKNFRVLW